MLEPRLVPLARKSGHCMAALLQSPTLRGFLSAEFGHFWLSGWGTLAGSGTQRLRTPGMLPWKPLYIYSSCLSRPQGLALPASKIRAPGYSAPKSCFQASGLIIVEESRAKGTASPFLARATNSYHLWVTRP